MTMYRCGRISILRSAGKRRYAAISTHGNRLNTTEAPAREIPIRVSSDEPSASQDTNCSKNDQRIPGKERGLGFSTSYDEDPPEVTPLYNTHIHTNYFQRAILTFGAAAAAIFDPHRHDMVAVLGETTGHQALSRLYTRMIEDSEGQLILVEKPRISSSTVDLHALSKLPADTLGHAYIRFLEDNKVTPDSRCPVKFVDDPELAYVMQRYREGHDLVHTVLGMPTNMLGEVAVKWVESLQTGLPMCYAGAVFGPLRFRPKQRQKYLSIYLPWAIRVGRTSKLLMNVYYEKRWEQSIHELRSELGIEPPTEL